MSPQVANGVPVKGANGHHDHDRDQRGHGNLPDPVTKEKQEQ